MTLVFQIAAVVVILIAGFFVVFRGSGARHLAIRRVLTLLFFVAAASSVFFPQAWTWVANLVGIGRGADLLLYAFVLVFLSYLVTTHRRFRQLEAQNTELARKLALLDVRIPDPPQDGPSASEGPTRSE